MSLAHKLAHKRPEIDCRARDSNPKRGFPQRFLRPPRLPFRQPGTRILWVGVVFDRGRHCPGCELEGGRILLEQMFGRSPDATYRRSQSTTGLPVQPSPIARGLALRIIDSSEDPQERKRLGQLLIDELDSLARLPHCDLVVADRAQVHSHNGQRLQSKTYGYYRCTFAEGEIKKARIRIYHRTAVRQHVISPKVFLNTLLHEWVHHYDFGGLRLARSPHTAGFYTRLRVLAEALEVSFVMPPEPGQTAAPATSAA